MSEFLKNPPLFCFAWQERSVLITQTLSQPSQPTKGRRKHFASPNTRRADHANIVLDLDLALGLVLYPREDPLRVVPSADLLTTEPGDPIDDLGNRIGNRINPHHRADRLMRPK